MIHSHSAASSADGGGASERPVRFSCGSDELIGVLHETPGEASTGVVIVVGGPQYRIGSHRQFQLLARALAEANVPALRFDCRGMGDSEGEFPGFENIGPDIAAALEAFQHHVPSLRRFVLWGLCDATPAIADLARRDSRIAGIVLLNPWVRSEEGRARAVLKHYYWRRAINPEFLRRLWSGEFDWRRSAHGLAQNLRTVFAGRRSDMSPVERIGENVRQFRGRVLLIISGRDLTAREFEDAASASPRWRKILAEERVTRRTLAEANHTFARRVWRDQVARWTQEWLATL
jgi:exosortase A-associated hydrolase 1